MASTPTAALTEAPRGTTRGAEGVPKGVAEPDVVRAVGRVEGLLTGRFDDVAGHLDRIEQAQSRLMDQMAQVTERVGRVEERVGRLEQARQGAAQWVRSIGGWILSALLLVWDILSAHTGGRGQ
jgi:hypothetical protein